VHIASEALWRGYAKTLRPTERRQWCNKIACGLHVRGAARADGEQPYWVVQGHQPTAPAVLGSAGSPAHSAVQLLVQAVLFGKYAGHWCMVQCDTPFLAILPVHCMQAAVLAYHQAWNLFDPVLTSNPLHGVTGGLLRSSAFGRAPASDQSGLAAAQLPDPRRRGLAHHWH